MDKKIYRLEMLLLYIISWGIGTFLLYKAYKTIDFNSPDKIVTIHYVFLLLGIGLLLLPFIDRVKVGNVLELEMQLEHTKEELESFKEQVHMNLKVFSTAISAVGNISSNYNYNYISPLPPSSREIELSEIELDGAIGTASVNEIIEIDNEENILELVKIRIKLETLLREEYSRLEILDYTGFPLAYMHQDLTESYPKLKNIYPSYRYIVTISNRALHGEYIGDSEFRKAIDMGKKLIGFLEEVFDKRIRN